MHSMPERSAILVVLLALLVGPTMGAVVEQKGKIEKVTVYRGQALVTRELALQAPAGAVELVVQELPAQVRGDTLYATGSENVSVRAVRYRTRAVSQTPRAEIRKLQEDIEQLQAEARKIENQQRVIAQRSAYLDKLETFSASRTGEEINKGSLDVESVMKLTEFLFKQRAELADKRLELQERTRAVQEQMQLLHRKVSELSSGTTKTVREAVVFLDKQAGDATVRLSYVVHGASWSPTYTARCGGRGERIELEYSAMVQQMSGEDWDGVDLQLSTASPTMVASAPVLTPLWVTLHSDGRQAPQMSGTSYVRTQMANAQALNKAAQARNFRANNFSDAVANDWGLNRKANEMQILDLQAGNEDIQAVRRIVRDDVLSVSYKLPGRISLPSRRDHQMIQIARLGLDADFHYVATPVLTQYVYQQAEMVNSSEIALLSGPVTTYLDGQFTGTGTIPLVAKGQRFSLGFGTDSQLRVKRQLVDKSEATQGGNRKLTFTYQFSIHNYKDAPVTVRLLDRLPDPQEADIKVTLGEMSAPLSDEQLYQKTLRKAGILMWEVRVGPNATGADSKTLEYSYSMEFARDMTIAEPSSSRVEQEKQDFKMKLDMYNLTH